MGNILLLTCDKTKIIKNHLSNSFLNNVCPKIEEILALSDQNFKILKKNREVPTEISNKGLIGTLLFDPNLTCIYSTTEEPVQKYISYSTTLDSIRIAFIIEYKGNTEPSRYFVTQSEINNIIKTDHVLVAGTKDGIVKE